MTTSIACLGWGSLIWDPRELPIQGGWLEDGPILPVEFARQSDSGKITLVIEPTVGTDVRTFWAQLKVTDLEEAQEVLRRREGTVERYIGAWPSKDGGGPVRQTIIEWAAEKGLDGVVWTALPPKFDGQNHVIPDGDQVIAYLESLEGPVLRDAKEYIQRAPSNIRTEYRHLIEYKLDWTAAASSQAGEGN